jgi:alpha-1,2-mannosyltransferase
MAYERFLSVIVLRDAPWLTRSRVVVYCGLLLAAYVLLIGWMLATSHGNLDSLGRPLGTDFANVWSSGRLVLDGRPADAFDPSLQAPYQQHLLGIENGIFYGWHYPPMFLLIAAALATMPYGLALFVWIASSGLAYLATIRMITGDSGIERKLVILAALAYPAVFANTMHGQNGCLSAALLGAGLALLPTRPMAAGVLIGLLAYKPQYALLVPFALMLAGHWRAIASASATVLATVLVSLAAFGAQAWTAFFQFGNFTRETVLESGAAGWFKLQGVFPAVRMLGGSVATAYTAQALAIAAIFAAVMWIWHAEIRHELKAATLILATMLATPYSFNYDTVLLGPAIAFLVVDGLKHGFAGYEKSMLALLWLTPFVSRELTGLTNIPLALIVQGSAFALLVHKVHAASLPSRSFAHV